MNSLAAFLPHWTTVPTEYLVNGDFLGTFDSTFELYGGKCIDVGIVDLVWDSSFMWVFACSCELCRH